MKTLFAALMLTSVAAWGQTQIAMMVPHEQEVAPGSVATVAVDYMTLPDNQSLMGLGLTLYWDSSALQFEGVDDVYHNRILAVSFFEHDDGNEDGDVQTDMLGRIAWADWSGNWPGDEPVPLRLLSVHFLSLMGEAGDSSVVNVRAISNAVGYDFVGYGATIYVQEEPAPSLDVDNDGRVDALSDGMLLMRFMFGFRGEALVNGIGDVNVTETEERLIRILE